MMPAQRRQAEVRLSVGAAEPGAKVDGGDRKIEVVWTTGAVVRRWTWASGEGLVEYDEELVVEPGAVRLDRMNRGAPFLDTHMADGIAHVLGSVEPGSARIEGGDGVATIRLTAAEDAQNAIQRVIERHVGVSVGYRVHKYERIVRKGQRELWRAVDWEPLEVSAVPIGADEGAKIRNCDRDQFAVEITEADVARIGSEKGEEGNVKGEVMETEARKEPAAGDGVDVSAVRAETLRLASEIMKLCARHGLDTKFASDLVSRGVTLDQARAAILDRLAENDPVKQLGAPVPAAARSEDDGYASAVENSLLHRYNPNRYKLDNSARELRGLSLRELARHWLERAGRDSRGMSVMEVASDVLTRAPGYHGTSDFPAILSNVANKTMRDAYDSTPRSFVTWARRTSLSDFKPVTRVQLSGAPALLQVPAGAEFQYGTMGESQESYALAVYGRIIAVSRHALVNDDLDAFTKVPAAFGASAANLESSVVYSILTGNPNMADGVPVFHASRGNIGTAATISEGSLAEASASFADRRGLDGALIDVQPSFILVPPGLRELEAVKNTSATTPSEPEDVNVFAGRYRVVVEPRLRATSGPDPWYMVADSARIDTIEYAYLDGQDGVYIENRLGFVVDGIEIKCRLEFAAKAIDWRGMYYNPGATTP